MKIIGVDALGFDIKEGQILFAPKYHPIIVVNKHGKTINFFTFSNKEGLVKFLNINKNFGNYKLRSTDEYISISKDIIKILGEEYRDKNEYLGFINELEKINNFKFPQSNIKIKWQ